MPSIGHIAVGLAAGRAYKGRRQGAGKAMLAFSLISILPDADVISFALGIPYSAPFGHRGATHSLAVAVLVGLSSLLVAKPFNLPPWKTALFVTAVAVSHGLLDTLTVGGGLGCALLWPFTAERFWSPVRFIPIAPIGLFMLSARGLLVIAAETVLFAPFWLYATWPGRRTSGPASSAG